MSIWFAEELSSAIASFVIYSTDVHLTSIWGIPIEKKCMHWNAFASGKVP